MQVINVINLDKYQPNYKDRSLIWIKVHIKLINSSYEFEVMHEIDKWRFIALCMLQTQFKKPVPSDPEYLSKKSFCFKHRPLNLTLKALSKAQLIEVIDVPETDNSVTKCDESVTQSRVEYIKKSKLEQKRKEESIPPYHTFGIVSLKASSYEELCKGYGKVTTDDYISKISEYCEAHGKSYKDYAAAIRQWIRRDKDDGKFRFKSDKFEKMEGLMKK